MLSSHRKRLGASITIALLSLVSIVVLLPRDKVTKLQKIALGTTIDDYAADLWPWGSDVKESAADDTGDGARLVVFGDSWVDETVQEGRGQNWPQILCEMINCSSRISFSASQSPSVYLQQAPKGVYTSNKVHELAYTKTQSLPPSESPLAERLPDFATQVQSFISLPVPTEQPRDTIFVLSFGFWDIYDLAGLDYAVAQNATDDSIGEIFTQLDILYDHFKRVLYPPSETPSNFTSKFKVVVPKLFDPTLTPGWISFRPAPVKPANVAEQQKNAIHLTQRWNQQLEKAMRPWLDSTAPSRRSDDLGTTEFPDPTAEPEVDRRLIEKDIFYYDTEKTMLDLIAEHHMEDESVTDANGLGKGQSPFATVEMPCLHTTEEGEDTGDLKDVNGLLQCTHPDEFFWWDAWNVGGAMNTIIGRDIGQKVADGKGLTAKSNGKTIVG